MVNFKQTYMTFPKYFEMRFRALFFKSYPFGVQNPLEMIIPLRFDFTFLGMINVLTDRAEMAIKFVVSVYFSFSQAYENCQIWRFIGLVSSAFRPGSKFCLILESSMVFFLLWRSRFYKTAKLFIEGRTNIFLRKVLAMRLLLIFHQSKSS